MRMRVLTEADHATMEVYASSYSAWIDYTIAMQKMPLIVDNTGTARINPLYSLVTGEYSKWRAAASELGLTPSSRSRIAINPRKEKKSDLLSE